MIDDRALQQLERQIDSWRVRVKDSDERKTYDEVFDKQTLLLLAKLMSDGVLRSVDYPVSTGKEGNVFHGTDPDGSALALKIYRVSNATFRNIANYIIGDSRFRNVRRSHKEIIYAWARKEYKNLLGMAKLGARVPRAIEQRNNVLAMSYIGDETRPAPLLREVRLDDPAAGFEDLVETMTAIRKAGLVHGDLSVGDRLRAGRPPGPRPCGGVVPAGLRECIAVLPPPRREGRRGDTRETGARGSGRDYL